MADESHGREKRRKLNHVGCVLSSSSQHAAPADLSRTGHTYPSISVDGGGQNHFGDYITINKVVNCDHTGERDEQAKRDKLLIESLTFDRMDARYANIATALPETCRWVFTHPHFVAWEGHWQNVNHRGFLWLKGKPGCGKSTIMKLVCARATNVLTDQVILTYFFNARAPGLLEKSSLGLYRSLAHQILTALPKARSIFLTKFRNKVKEGRVEEWTAAELKDFLIAVIAESNPPPIGIFIDALDEGAESDIRDMVVFFEGFQHHAYARSTTLRICFSSRHYPHITIRTGLEIVVEQQIGHDTDILRYIQLNLHGDQSPSMDEFRRKVHQKSSGVFLWVILVIPMLNTIFDRGKSLGDASRCLDNIPKELDALLVDIMTRSDEDIDECVSLLQWVTFAMEPLAPRELYVATLYNGTSSPAETVEIPDQDRIEKYLLHCSRGLVEVTRSDPPQMQFIHETIRGFLLGENGLVRMDAQLKPNLEGTSHDKLKEACLQCITYEVPHLSRRRMDSRTGYDSDYSENKFSQKSNYPNYYAGGPLLRYATVCLFGHADAAQRCGQSQLRFVQAIKEDRNDIFTKFKRAVYFFRVMPYAYDYLPRVTPLHFFAEWNLVDLAQCLIDSGVDVNAMTAPFGGALYAASENGYQRMVQLLLDRGADVNIPGGYYGNALEAASVFDNLQTVQLLLDRGAGVNILGGYYGSALHAASSEGHLQIVQLLLDRGADVKIGYGPDNWTALQKALLFGYSKVVQLLRKYGAR